MKQIYLTQEELVLKNISKKDLFYWMTYDRYIILKHMESKVFSFCIKVEHCCLLLDNYTHIPGSRGIIKKIGGLFF